MTWSSPPFRSGFMTEECLMNSIGCETLVYLSGTKECGEALRDGRCSAPYRGNGVMKKGFPDTVPFNILMTRESCECQEISCLWKRLRVRRRSCRME
jgi:E3 ubiquitin-protein ligase DOA10